MEDEPLGRDAGRQGDVQLAAGCHVEVHAFLVGQLGHGSAQEGLGGVGHAVAPGGHGLSAGLTQVILVVDEERGPELLGQVEEVDATHVEMALAVHLGRPRQQMPLQRRRGDVVVHGHGAAGYGTIPPAPGDQDPPATTATIVLSRDVRMATRPRSSADRAPASGAGGAGSSPAGGAHSSGPMATLSLGRSLAIFGRLSTRC